MGVLVRITSCITIFGLLFVVIGPCMFMFGVHRWDPRWGSHGEDPQGSLDVPIGSVSIQGRSLVDVWVDYGLILSVSSAFRGGGTVRGGVD